MLRTWLKRLFQSKNSSFSPRRPRLPRPANGWPRLEQLEDRLAPALYAVTPDLHVLPLAAAGGSRTEAPAAQVVFIESSVTQAATLLDGLAPNTDGVLLAAGGDGLREMAAFLAGRHDLTAIHLVAHGRAGAISLGTASLNEATLADAQAELAVLGSALGGQGQLDLWSCDVAAGRDGQAFVNDLAAATGRNVAAASHLVGAAARGGSWHLDDQVGKASAASPFTPGARDQFSSILALPWSPAASLSTARDSATATLLANGKVLVAGGYGSSGDLASAELYDPMTTTWSTTGSLNTARYDATATLLANGKVLVAGGENISGILSSAELYDPMTTT